MAGALGGRRVFVTNQYDSTVSVVDAESLGVVATIDVGEYPEGIAGHPDDHQVWVANWFDNTVTVLDAERLSIQKTIPVGDGARAFGEFISLGASAAKSSASFQQ